MIFDWFDPIEYEIKEKLNTFSIHKKGGEIFACEIYLSLERWWFYELKKADDS